MLVSTVFLAALSGRLTCGEVMMLLMDQPTRPNGRNIESHAHMHVQEGFKLNRDGFGGSDAAFEKKQMHWEEPTHLYPAGATSRYGVNDYGRMLTSGGGGSSYTGVLQDPNRLPPTREYADRTGLNELPEVKAPTRYFAYKVVQRGKPERKEFAKLDEVQQLPTSDYTFKKGAIVYQEQEGAVQLPRVPKSPAHSMFPDSESQVMHLTAALKSDAGQRVLHHLLYNVAPGEQATSGIFSKTAVRAVAVADANVPNQMFERRLEVDLLQGRQATGRYPTTGKILKDISGIDHVVVVLGKRISGDLNVITCYPSKMAIRDTIGAPANDKQDVAELVYTHHIVMDQLRTLPVLRW